MAASPDSHLTSPTARSRLMILETDCNKHFSHLSSLAFRSPISLSGSLSRSVRPLGLRIAALFGARFLTKSKEDASQTSDIMSRQILRRRCLCGIRALLNSQKRCPAPSPQTFSISVLEKEKKELLRFVAEINK